ncbi:MAG: outer membrane beta-barrel protein [Bacteroidota bacterium]
MPRLLLVVCVGTALSGAATAQSPAVSGVVNDSSGTGLPGATVVLLQPGDSTIVSFAASRTDGAFRIPRVVPGDYLLQITYVGYLPSTRPLAVGAEGLDVGRISLEVDLDGLDPLVVTADRVAMVLKADTLEFNADAFGVPEGSSVEDLLRRLPGVRVDRDGSIQAQGEDVARVLVDGKEFFGTDPTIATRNLPADAVDRVQVYDRDSETAEFTGVADGNEERTINLALKEDRRTGTFGRLSGGLGGSSAVDGRANGVRFDGSASVNRFSPSTQMSFLGNANNINRQDFGVEDYIQFMGGISAFAGGNLRLRSEDIGIPLGTGPSDGFTTTFAGGLNLNHDFGADTKLESNYFGSRIGTDRQRDLRRQQLLGSNLSAATEQADETTSQTQMHRLNLHLLHAFADGHDLRLRSNLRMLATDRTASSQRETLGPAGLLEADRVSASETDAHTPGGDVVLTYRKRLPKRRSVVAQARTTLQWDGDHRDLVARNRDGDGLAVPPIDQRRDQSGATVSQSGSLLLTQPLTSRRALQLDAAHTIEHQDEDRTVLDRLTGVPVRDEALSSAFERTTHVTRGGITFRDNGENHQFSLRATLQRTQLDGEILDQNAPVARTSLHLLPSASLRYTFPRDQQLTLNYQASTTEPTLRQLQPVVDNRNPLNLYVGTPDLEPELRHALSARFIHFDTFSLTTLTASVRGSYAPTALSTARTVDAEFRQTRTPINTSGAWSVTGNASFRTPIRPVRTTVSLEATSRVRRQIEQVNGAESRASLTRSTLSVRLENQRKTGYDVQAGGRLTLDTSAYSLSPEFNRRYLTPTFFAEGSVEIGASWFLRSSLDLEWIPSDVFGSARSVPLWSLDLSRRVNDRVRLRLVGTDLLDQGIGIQYASAGAFVQEERVRSLGRHVLLNLVYTLSEVRT